MTLVRCFEPTKPVTKQTPGLRQLVAYGSVAAPLAVLMVPLYAYLPAFYSASVGLSLTAVGVVFFLSRIWDGLLDPTVGVLSDRTRSRFGRRKPWVALCAPILAVTSWLLCVPPSGAGVTYLAVVIFVFYFAWTCVQIPHLSWAAELTSGYDARNRVVVVREVCFMLGILTAVVVPVWLFGTTEFQLSQVLAFYAILAAVLLPLTGIAAAAMVPDDPADSRSSHIQFGELIQILRQRPGFVRLVIAYFFMQLGLSTYDAVAYFLVSKAVSLPGLFLTLAALQFVVTIATIPVMSGLGRRIEKHRMLCAFTVLFPIGVGLLAATPAGNQALAVLAYVVIGASVAPYRVMPTSMVADCADFDHSASGRDRIGTHMALLTLAYKLALAGGVGIAFPLLDLAGFNSTGENAPGALTALRLVGGVLPILLILPTTFILWRYPLTRAVHAELVSAAARGGR